MRVLVCGSRVWSDKRLMETVLLGLHLRRRGELTIIEGCARGADRLAESFIKWAGIGIEHYPADWDAHGKAAGPMRNQQMLDARPDLVVAFKDGFDHSLSKGGTEHMVKIAKKAGVSVWVMSHA